MTSAELVTLHFLVRDCGWSAVVVAGLVIPWLLAARRLKVPHVVAPTTQKPRTLGALPHRASRSRRCPSNGRDLALPKPQRSPRATGATSGKAPRVSGLSVDPGQIAQGLAKAAPVRGADSRSRDQLRAPDTTVEDAVLACQQLGFAKRDAASVVLGFRAQLPSATCDELIRRALGAMSQGKSRRLT